MIRFVRRGADWRRFVIIVSLTLGTGVAQRDVAWRTTFSAGVLEADAVERPVLLWAMNGHPLGCT